PGADRVVTNVILEDADPTEVSARGRVVGDDQVVPDGVVAGPDRPEAATEPGRVAAQDEVVPDAVALDLEFEVGEQTGDPHVVAHRRVVDVRAARVVAELVGQRTADDDVVPNRDRPCHVVYVARRDDRRPGRDQVVPDRGVL